MDIVLPLTNGGKKEKEYANSFTWTMPGIPKC